MYKVNVTCGQCAYYVRRPPEIVARCSLDGVCLKAGRAVDSGMPANAGVCSTSFVVGVGSVANGFRERDSR